MSSPLRIRLLAGCVLLVGLALVQSPGFLAADTKLDLVGDPGDFLARALHLWDGRGALGQLQNQAYGYLWPMGPFFALGDLLGTPGWVVQRLWLALVLVVAFSGATTLARLLGVRSDLACLAAGFAYALSPRMLTTLGPISIEAWPGAVAPWVLVPLVIGSRRGSPRLAAALAALAVGMVGGVNAAATFAVLPLGVLWLLTREPGPRRRAMMWWWPPLTALATAWWLVPLFTLGAYSPPFLDYIETTAVTTFPTTLFDVLRGTSNWVPYLDPASRAGRDLIATSALAIDAAVLLLLGLAGLLHPRTPHRRFLGLAVVMGVAMVAAGHAGAVEGFGAVEVRALLDGVLAPLRNVHKFDPVLRLPLVIGVAFTLDRALAARRERAAATGDGTGDGTGDAVQVAGRLEQVNRAALVGMTLVVIVASAVPAVLGRIVPANSFLDVPPAWAQAAAWLEERSGDRATLLVPGSAFADYDWGAPRDEPMQWLAGSRWAVRNVVPLVPPNNVRLLDAVEERLAQGRGSAGLSGYLRRAGIEFLLVRNDLRRDDDVPDPVLVHQALETSPGLALVAAFGEPVGGRGHLVENGTRVLVNGGWQDRRPALEVYAVDDVTTAVSTRAPAVVAGGPEDLLDLTDLGVLDQQPTVLAPDLQQSPASDWPVVLTDGLRARENAFARLHDGTSAVLTPGDVRRTTNTTRDYLAPGAERWTTRAVLDGARAVSASSSQSDSTAVGGSERGELPYAAVDALRTTQWVSRPDDEPAWWQLDLDDPTQVTTVDLRGGESAAGNQRVRVRLDGWASPARQLGPGVTRTVAVPASAGPTSTVRVEEVGGARGLALAEVRPDDLVVERVLVPPALPPEWGGPDVVVLRSDLDARRGCARVSGVVRCRADRARTSEEPAGLVRDVDLGGAATWSARITARPRAGRALDRLVLRAQLVDVSVSTTAVDDPRASAVAAVDADPGSAWQADPDDLRPSLVLSWLTPRRVTGLDLRRSLDATVRLPTRVRLTWPGGRRTIDLDEGRARFAPIRTASLDIRVLAAEPVDDLGFDGLVTPVGIGIGEARVRGVPGFPVKLSADTRTYACGTGPDLVVDDEVVRTRLRASPAALLQGAESPAVPCGGRAALALTGGVHRVSLGRTQAATGASVVLTRAAAGAGAVSPTDAAPADGARPGPSSRRLEPGPGAELVALKENQNPGWRATREGATLDPVVVDGWQQGWWLTPTDAPGAPVLATYTPDRTYRAGLLGGAGAVVLLLLLVGAGWWRRGRHAAHAGFPAGDVERRLPTALLAGIALLVAGWVAGLVGVALAVLTALALVGSRRHADVAVWVLASPVLAVGAAYAVLPWGSATGWAGNLAWTAYACVVPLVALVLAPASARPAPLDDAREPRQGRRSFSARLGRSTKR